MQKRLHFAVLVKGLFSPAKNLFASVLSPNNKSRAFSPHRSNRGAGLKFIQQTSSGNLGVCLKREPASHLHLEN